jgi:hypothetical protein
MKSLDNDNAVFYCFLHSERNIEERKKKIYCIEEEQIRCVVTSSSWENPSGLDLRGRKPAPTEREDSIHLSSLFVHAHSEKDVL